MNRVKRNVLLCREGEKEEEKEERSKKGNDNDNKEIILNQTE